MTRLHAAFLSLICLLGSRAAPDAHAEPESARILPANPTLTGPNATQRLLLLNTRDNQFRGPRPNARFTSDRPEIAEVDAHGRVTAKGDGQALITATSDGVTAQTTVTVNNTDHPTAWSFRNHVLPVLSKAGCNQGACHGALAGKGGFKLSLRGYDPFSDHQHITREAQGRRIELAAPATSLLLTKPTTAVRHKGGRRLEPDSHDYRVLAEWITQGARAPSPQDDPLHHIEVAPAHSVLPPGATQPLVVRAFYKSGRAEDVTAWARYSSTDETVAQVDANSGEITVAGYGEGAVTVWFSSRIVLARITSPYTNNVPDAVFAGQTTRNFIDELVLAQLKRLNLKPSPRSSDAEFIRRAFFDVIGLPPTPDETRAFLNDANGQKRTELIDRLLQREEFVDYWTYRWSDVFLINSRLLRPNAVKAYYDWLRQQVESNLPWDRLVRQVVTATGGSLTEGASNFYAVHQDPETMAENVSQAFLSLSIGCAKCHNHPLEKWTNDQYYSFANLFARVRAKGWGGDPRSGDGVRTLYVASRGDLIQPRTGKPQPPAPLDGDPFPADDPGDRRDYLADWLTSPENPYFTRSIANRVWAAYFGRGLVEPVDDLRVSNPATNEPLLDRLAQFLTEHRYDLKALMRLILNSETYQRTSRPLPENRDEYQFFSRYYPRRLMAEVLHDNIAAITDIPSTFDKITLTDGSTEKIDFYPQGTRALELYDASVDSYFLKTFGRNERAITCECERSNQPSMVQVLHLSNGDALNDRLAHKDSRVTHLLKAGLSNEQLIETAFLWCLCRRPAPEEQAQLLPLLNSTPPPQKREVIEDLFWALMTSREFLFQH